MSAESWHRRMDLAVERAAKIKRLDPDERLPRIVYTLLDDMLWLAEHHPDGRSETCTLACCVTEDAR